MNTETQPIRRCDHRDFDSIWTIINDGAQVYKDALPHDLWTEPYMSLAELERGIEEGIVFWGFEDNGKLAGVMGLQRVDDVDLIRHAYVRTASQQRGIGAQLLIHLRALSNAPMLVGTWAAAVWAIRFYEKHAFQLVNKQEKDRLLRRYWNVSERQIETSVVLADSRGRALLTPESYRSSATTSPPTAAKQ